MQDPPIVAMPLVRQHASRSRLGYFKDKRGVCYCGCTKRTMKQDSLKRKNAHIGEQPRNRIRDKQLQPVRLESHDVLEMETMIDVVDWLTAARLDVSIRFGAAKSCWWLSTALLIATQHGVEVCGDATARSIAAIACKISALHHNPSEVEDKRNWFLCSETFFANAEDRVAVASEEFRIMRLVVASEGSLPSATAGAVVVDELSSNSDPKRVYSQQDMKDFSVTLDEALSPNLPTAAVPK
jgi:hypothetical protein